MIHRMQSLHVQKESTVFLIYRGPAKSGDFQLDETVLDERWDYDFTRIDDSCSVKFVPPQAYSNSVCAQDHMCTSVYVEPYAFKSTKQDSGVVVVRSVRAHQ